MDSTIGAIFGDTEVEGPGWSAGAGVSRRLGEVENDRKMGCIDL